MQHTFISYVREDASVVDRIQKALETAGIRVWRDKDELWPGEDWRQKIREAIQDDSLMFIACISHNSEMKLKSFQREELNLAIGELRQRRPDVPWLIPVRLSDCPLPPSFDVGAGRTLDSLQWVDLFDDTWEPGIQRLVGGIKRAAAAMNWEPSVADPSLGARLRGSQGWMDAFVEVKRSLPPMLERAQGMGQLIRRVGALAGTYEPRMTQATEETDRLTVLNSFAQALSPLARECDQESKRLSDLVSLLDVAMDSIVDHLNRRTTRVEDTRPYLTAIAAAAKAARQVERTGGLRHLLASLTTWEDASSSARPTIGMLVNALDRTQHDFLRMLGWATSIAAVDPSIAMND